MPFLPISHDSTCSPYKYKESNDTAAAVQQDKNNASTASRKIKGIQKTGMLTWFVHTLQILSHIQMVGNSSTYLCKTSLPAVPMPTNACGIATSIERVLSDITPPLYDCMADIRPEALQFLQSQSSISAQENAHRMKHPAVAPTPSGSSGFLQLPMAQATVTPSSAAALSWNPKHHFFTIADDNEKGRIIKDLVDLLVKTNQLEQPDADRYEFQWKQRVTGKMLYLMQTNSINTHTLEKRRSFQDIDREIADHIEKNCAFETEIVDLKGRTVAELQLFQLQKIEKFLETPASTLARYLHLEPSSGTSSVLDNIALVLFSQHLDIPEGMALVLRNYFTRESYKQKNDEICLMRQNRYALGSIATNLEVAGLGKFQLRKHILKKPPELQQIYHLDSNAIFYAKNKQTGTKTELIMTAQAHRDRINQVDNVVIKEKGPENYVASHVNPGQSKSTEIPISFDDAAEIWREAFPPHLPLLNVEFQSGRTFVMIQGEQYPLRMTRHMQYQIELQHLSGVTEFLPVYRDKISKSWHLKIANNHPVFTPRARKLIAQLKIPLDKSKHFEFINNQNIEYYGDGKLILIRDHANGPVINTVVEMNRELIPVRRSDIDNYGCRYDAFDLQAPHKAGYPIVWDGDRWNIERMTSPHLSKELIQRITPDMYVNNLHSDRLSAADERGLRWSKEQHAYIKFRNHFVRLYQESHGSPATLSEKRIAVIYNDGHFHPSAPPTDPRITVHIDGKPHTAVKPSIPSTSPLHTDELITRNFNSMFKYMLANYWVPGMKETNLLDVIKQYFPTEDIQVKRVSSNKADSIRFIATVENEQYVLEMSPNGDNTRILVGKELENALSKYQQRHLGGDIQHIIGLTNGNAAVAATIRHTPNEIVMITRKRIQAGCAEIKNLLDHRPFIENGTTLVVGNNDFFDLGSFANNACAPPKATYKALIDFCLQLSRDNPNVIIAPGSIPMSEDIPESLRAKDLIYQQDHQELQVKQAVHFTAVIAPVFFNGKIISIARKGDYLAYMMPDEHQDDKMQTVNLEDLDVSIPAHEHLISHNENEDNFIQPIDLPNHREGTIFAGKTLLPGERKLIGSLLQPHMADNTTMNIFQSEFVIDENKFLLVIGNEFKQFGDFRPSIRRQALPDNDARIHGSSFDYIIHIAFGELLDRQLYLTGDSYIQVDNNGSSRYHSDVVSRVHSFQSFSTSHLSIHNYDLSKK